MLVARCVRCAGLLFATDAAVAVRVLLLLLLSLMLPPPALLLQSLVLC